MVYHRHSVIRSPITIADAVAVAMKARSARTEITADRVLHELAAIAFLDPAKIFTPTGEVRALDDIDESVRRFAPAAPPGANGSPGSCRHPLSFADSGRL